MSERSYLEEISIRNLGIIEQSELELGRGLNVLTGETGAGKTMILTALSLVLGGKSDSSLVRHGSERLVATAQFSVTSDSKEQLDEIGAEVDGSSLIVTRTVNSDGKSKASCGGVTVPAGTLADVTEPLIEIHGQSANSQIVKPARQRELLDRFGGSAIATSLTSYQEIYTQYLELKERIKAMRASANKRDGEIAELEEFLAAWAKLKAVRNEPSAVEDEIKRLSSVEDLRIASSGALSALDSEESGALTLLHSARRFLDAAKGKDSRLEEIAERVAESLFILDDASSDLASYATGLEADPEKLDVLQQRKAELNLFIKRWGGAASADEELVALAAKAKSGKESIADLKGGDERITVEYQYRTNEILNVQERAKFNETPSLEFSQVAKIQLANINLLYKLGTLKLPKMVKKYRSGKVIEQESTFRSLEHEGTKVIAMTPRWDVSTPELQTWQNDLLDYDEVPGVDFNDWLDQLP